MYSRPNSKPNQCDVAQILNLEFEARRAFIDSDAIRKEDRAAKVMDAYPCFKDPRHAIDELGRILGGTNKRYIDETKNRWENFCANVQLYGLWKKVLKKPFPIDTYGAEFTIALLQSLPSLFPSPKLPPKRLGNASEALIHVLQGNEDPNKYLETRPLSSPVLLYDGTVCILAIGEVPVSPLENVFDGMITLMAYYYAFNLTYPKCIATLLSVIQTEVLSDEIHESDATRVYKKTMTEWKEFTTK
ncbi:uncharacterized protein LOC122129896 [Clupea harengus]|uniref:Uncharacterized protein LOC122129896 n=1 Tax=Clupea harengus TaxID=7950 RepID=A0A8M1K933_CLUHA|nr:uncharacterized protein LOC122129896 [Clupea harengus]